MSKTLVIPSEFVVVRSPILSDCNQENNSFCHHTVLTRPKSSSDDEILDLSHKIVETPKSTK